MAGFCILFPSKTWKALVICCDREFRIHNRLVGESTDEDYVVRPADAFKGSKRKTVLIAGKEVTVPFQVENPLRAFVNWLAGCVALTIILLGGVWLWRHWVARWVKNLVMASFVGWEVLCFLFVGGAVAYEVLDHYFGKRK